MPGLTGNQVGATLRCLYDFPEWVHEREKILHSGRAITYDGMPHSTTYAVYKETEEKAIALAMVERKISIVEEACQAADPEIWKDILVHITTPDHPWHYFRCLKDRPYGERRFRRARRMALSLIFPDISILLDTKKY